MAIKYIDRKEIDTEKWDACIASHPETASLFAETSYLDACCEQWSALVQDDYQAVMPLPWKKKAYIYYVYPPFFLPRLGLYGKEIPAGELPEWINAIPSYFKWIDKVLNISIPENPYLYRKHKTYRLDLSLPYEEIQQGYHQNHKRNCRKANENGLKMVNNFPCEEVINLFRNKNAKTYKAGYTAKDYRQLPHLLQVLQEKQQLEMWGVLDSKDTLCAGAFFPFDEGKYYFLFSGRNTESNTNKAMFFLIDQFIRHHAGQNKILDFNGSNHPDIAKFYAGFGAEAMNYDEIHVSRFRPLEKLGFNLYTKLNRLK
ncbi:MAG: hypothetical protein BWY27_00504 [Bacteroidetes bacterium ADurb.Bin234]|nr:MAG: hypothetical protein BWY27_00504 [Bacteroidetes bacterium ADurb.Bin234]